MLPASAAVTLVTALVFLGVFMFSAFVKFVPIFYSKITVHLFKSLFTNTNWMHLYFKETIQLFKTLL
jgi:hypothetical protein